MSNETFDTVCRENLKVTEATRKPLVVKETAIVGKPKHDRALKCYNCGGNHYANRCPQVTRHDLTQNAGGGMQWRTATASTAAAHPPAGALAITDAAPPNGGKNTGGKGGKGKNGQGKGKYY